MHLIEIVTKGSPSRRAQFYPAYHASSQWAGQKEILECECRARSLSKLS